MFRTPLDPRFTAPSQSTPTFLHNCFLQNGLPLLLRCLADFAQQSPLTKSEAQREYHQAKVRKGSKTILQRFQGCETYRSSQLNIG